MHKKLKSLLVPAMGLKILYCQNNPNKHHLTTNTIFSKNPLKTLDIVLKMWYSSLSIKQDASKNALVVKWISRRSTEPLFGVRVPTSAPPMTSLLS